jgi:hypothetical protein
MASSSHKWRRNRLFFTLILILSVRSENAQGTETKATKNALDTKKNSYLDEFAVRKRSGMIFCL